MIFDFFQKLHLSDSRRFQNYSTLPCGLTYFSLLKAQMALLSAPSNLEQKEPSTLHIFRRSRIQVLSGNRPVQWGGVIFDFFLESASFRFLKISKLPHPTVQSHIFFPAKSPDGIAQGSFEDGAKRAYNTTYFPAVPHPSTIAAPSCL